MNTNETINRLVNASKVLKERQQALNDELKQHEQYINSLNLGVEAGVELPNKHVIGYGRVKGKWGLYHKVNRMAPSTSIHEAPLLARLAMHLHLHYVVKALVLEANITTKQLQEATQLAREFLNAMGIDENGKVKV